MQALLQSRSRIPHYFTKCTFSTHPSPKNLAAGSGPKAPKVTIESLYKSYAQKIPITVMTAHDYPSAMFCEKSGIDIVLVGDSLAMVALGYESTNPITLEEMMHHSRAVERGNKVSFLVGDLPFGTYESHPEQAVQNAIRFLKEGKMEAVKIEGGKEMGPTVKKITQVGVPVLGHIGLTPQRVSSLSGFKAQGRTLERAQKLVYDAMALQEAGAFAIVLEAIPQVVATVITEKLSIPTIGIGAGPTCSGQVLVQLDLLGAYDKLAPRFAKVYGQVGQQSIDALKQYVSEVKNREFPVSGEHTFKMLAGQEEFLDWAKTFTP